MGRHSALTIRNVGALRRHPFVAALLLVALTLPLVGLVSLVRINYAHWHWTNPRLHFVLFLVVGGTCASLALVAGEAARRRGDARVLLLALAFLSTGGFMALHAAGTATILVDDNLPGFGVAISAGLLLAAVFALAAAFVDVRPRFGRFVTRHRRRFYATVFGAMAVWTVWTLAAWPPLNRPVGEGGNNTSLKVAAAVGALCYAAAALRLFHSQRRQLNVLVVSVVACFVLLAEALVGVTLAGELKWHGAWWEWHVLIVAAYLVVFTAAHHEWRDERFHELYLPATREHAEDVTVLVGDLAGFTTFTESHEPAEVATMLRSYFVVAAPLISRRFGGEVEKFTGDGIFATFNRRGDQPDHAQRAVRAAVALQAEVEKIRADQPSWPGMRIGINTGPVVVVEMGGPGYITYPAVGDPVNVAARLQTLAPVGGVMIGAETHHRLLAGTAAESVPGLRLKGKDVPVDAFLLTSPDGRQQSIVQVATSTAPPAS